MDFEVYCDESRQELFRTPSIDKNKYVIIGGLWIEASKRSHYKDLIKDLREKHKIYGEYKWNKVSPSREQFYLEIIRLFFREEIRFRCIVLNASEMDTIHFHHADAELMFYKFYYQLLHPWIYDFNIYNIFIDIKTNRLPNRLQVLKRVLSNSNISTIIKDVQALPSKEVDLIQMVDLLIGAVGYSFHGLKSSSSKHKITREIERFLPSKKIKPTWKCEEKFNIFMFRPGGGW